MHIYRWIIYKRKGTQGKGEKKKQRGKKENRVEYGGAKGREMFHQS